MFLIFIAIFAPILSPYEFDKVNPTNALAPPSLEHFMVQILLVETFSRVLHGTTTSLSLALTTIIFGLITGVSIGAISGYFVGIIDEIIMRIVDVFMSIPGVILALAMVSILGPNPIYLVLALSIRRIIQFARVTRGVVLSIKELDYISACHAIGVNCITKIIFSCFAKLYWSNYCPFNCINWECYFNGVNFKFSWNGYTRTNPKLGHYDCQRK